MEIVIKVVQQFSIPKAVDADCIWYILDLQYTLLD